MTGKTHSTIKTATVAATVTPYSPAPMPIPSAAASQIVAAVVKPMTRPESLSSTPAPRKPTPVTIFAATRTGSSSPPIRSENVVNKVAPVQIRMIVRNPAGRSRYSRSAPISPPMRADIKSLIRSSCVKIMDSLGQYLMRRQRSGLRRLTTAQASSLIEPYSRSAARALGAGRTIIDICLRDRIPCQMIRLRQGAATDLAVEIACAARATARAARRAVGSILGLCFQQEGFQAAPDRCDMQSIQIGRLPSGVARHDADQIVALVENRIAARIR